MKKTTNNRHDARAGWTCKQLCGIVTSVVVNIHLVGSVGPQTVINIFSRKNVYNYG